MPQILKIYIAGVVTLSAFALVVATFVFPVDPSDRPRSVGSSDRRQSTPSTLELASASPSGRC